MTISYNPAVLEAMTVNQGTFMQQGGATSSFVPKIDQEHGRIDIAIARTGDTSGANGTGLLAAVVFKPIAAGSSPIAVTGVAMNTSGQPIHLQVVPALVTVK